jgi:hypothetical protein
LVFSLLLLYLIESQSAVEPQGKPIKGLYRRIGTTLNKMVDRLEVFAVEVTRVAHDVGNRPLAQFELSPSPPAPLPNLGEGSHKRYEDRGSA